VVDCVGCCEQRLKVLRSGVVAAYAVDFERGGREKAVSEMCLYRGVKRSKYTNRGSEVDMNLG
jgi:hypothetical protein